MMPKPPLTPFADELPLPRRLIASQEGSRLTIPIRTGTHRFHRDLPESSVWGFEATFPGPTIEVERGEAVTVDGSTSSRGPCR